MPEAVTVYTPESSLANPLRMLADMWRDLLRSRHMAWQLASRDIRAQYRQAFLGLLWAFIAPVATTLTWVFLSGTGVISVGHTALPYPVFVFTGTLLWSILVDAMTAPLQQNNAARSILAKLNFPREAILLSGLLQLLFNTSIKVALMLAALLIVGIKPTWALLLFPLGLAALMLAGTAIGLLLTPLGMLYADVGRAVPLLMSFLMYLSPVVFPAPQEGLVGRLYAANPFTPLIVTTRDWLTGQPPTQLGYFVIVVAACAAVLLVAWAAWRLAMPIIIERVGD